MPGSDKVVFDVGGEIFSTTVKTINRYPDSLLAALCEKCHDSILLGDEIYIDRSPEGFGWILEIFRGTKRSSGKWRLPLNWSLDDIEDELEFYQLPSATEFIPFHGHMLVRMEKDALRKLAEEMCREIAKVRKYIIFSPFVRFLVWRYVSEADRLHAEHIDKFDYRTSSQSLMDVANSLQYVGKECEEELPPLSFKGRWTNDELEVLSLNNKQVSSLSEIMLEFGFKVFKAFPKDDSGPEAISFLTVSWEI
ncbi:hypothetical protein BSKO_12977 [Bryopsis sp. KO-2023]|nr:hypothetical protein BSKO_12977 [Bryopsis sp. KO-2023]